jgi:hypothetical protein
MMISRDVNAHSPPLPRKRERERAAFFLHLSRLRGRSMRLAHSRHSAAGGRNLFADNADK